MYALGFLELFQECRDPYVLQVAASRHRPQYGPFPVSLWHTVTTTVGPLFVALCGNSKTEECANKNVSALGRSWRGVSFIGDHSLS